MAGVNPAGGERGSRSGDHSGESVPRYRIGAVARATGIRAETLRIWERRYKAFEPTRTPGGGRLYTDDDIDRLRLIKDLLDRGHAISGVARLSARELREIASRQGPQPIQLSDVRAQFISAAMRLDVVEAHRIVHRAALLLDDRTLALEILAPILRDVGDGWARGKLQVCHEHAASHVMRNVLGILLATRPGPERTRGTTPASVTAATTRTCLTASPCGELHEFGASLAGLIASAHGWRIVSLGPNVPSPDIITAAREVAADMVAISVVNAPSAATRADLARLAENLPRDVLLIGGGRHVEKSKAFAARARIFADLSAFDAWLEQSRVAA